MHLRIVALCVAAVLAAGGCSEEETSTGVPWALVTKDPREVSTPIARAVPMTVSVTLVAREVVAEIALGQTFWYWTFNGSVPGPLIRVMEGDTVDVTLVNSLDSVEPHNLDFHAAIAPGGGADATNVAPGETRNFQFVATRQGAYLYHCAAEGMPWEHLSRGMYGLILVEPPGGLAPGYREFYVGQSEWYVSPVPDEEGGEEEEEEEEGGEGEEEEEEEEGEGGGATLAFDWAKAAAELPEYYTFNGHTRALTDPALFGAAMQVVQGSNVRIFYVNAGPNKTSSLHLVGGIFDRVMPGYFGDVLRNVETVSVASGSALVAEFSTPALGTFPLVDHALFRIPKGAAGTVTVVPP